MPLPKLAESCRVVIVAVPIAATLDVIRTVGPHLPEDALLMDLTSLKEEPVRVMVEATAAEVVGCHPLFGPDCPSLAGQNIVLCPGRGERWLNRMEGLFAKGGARVTVTTPAEHDRMMALVQGLTHLDTILMGLTLRDSGVEAIGARCLFHPRLPDQAGDRREGLRPPPRDVRGHPRGKSGDAGDPRQLREESLPPEGAHPESGRRGPRGPPEKTVISRRTNLGNTDAPLIPESPPPEMNDDPLNVSLNILRFHQILRPNESFHTFLRLSPINLINCY